MNAAMMERLDKVVAARKTLQLALEDLQAVCDHRDEYGQENGTYDFESGVVYCRFCHGEIGD